MSNKLKIKIYGELDSGYREQMMGIPASHSSAHQQHRKWTLLFWRVPEGSLQRSAFPSLLLSLSSSHPDSVTQMAAHALFPFPISVSNLEGEMRVPIANSRSDYILIVTLSLIKRRNTGTRVRDQGMSPHGTDPQL